MDPLRELGRALLVLGALLVFVGALLYFGGKLPLRLLLPYLLTSHFQS